MKVSIRPLKVSDASISWVWRNDPEIWNYTNNKPNLYVTEEIEKKWIKKVIRRKTEKRFAICVGDQLKYIGNIQITDIRKQQGQFHIFIGDKNYWGKGIGTKATKLLLSYARTVLNISEIYLYVDKSNISAISIYKKCGFKINQETEEKYLMIK